MRSGLFFAICACNFCEIKDFTFFILRFQFHSYQNRGSISIYRFSINGNSVCHCLRLHHKNRMFQNLGNLFYNFCGHSRMLPHNFSDFALVPVDIIVFYPNRF